MLKFWNFWPPFFFTGVKIQKVSPDYRTLTAKLKLRFWNANYVGTAFGGSMFVLADPFYMVMLMRNLGHEYSVWDKSANIRFLKPGRTDLFADFLLTDEDLAQIKTEVSEKGKIEWRRTIEIKDKEGVIVAEVEKVISIKRKAS
jgi:acyl-coenzyme A thioesterase PaaI-like protein